MKKEYETRDNQIKKLEDRLLTVDHELKTSKIRLNEELKPLQDQNAKLRQANTELKQQTMRQEESINGWLEEN